MQNVDFALLRGKFTNLMTFTHMKPEAFNGPSRKDWPACSEVWAARDLGVAIGEVFESKDVDEDTLIMYESEALACFTRENPFPPVEQVIHNILHKHRDHFTRINLDRNWGFQDEAVRGITQLCRSMYDHIGNEAHLKAIGRLLQEFGDARFDVVVKTGIPTTDTKGRTMDKGDFTLSVMQSVYYTFCAIAPCSDPSKAGDMIPSLAKHLVPVAWNNIGKWRH